MSKAGAASPKEGKKKNSKGSEVVSKSSASSPFGHQNQVLSRYLSDSIGSCHDFCKYGRKPSVDEEGSSSTIKNFIAEKRRTKKKTIITFDGDGGKCILAKKEKNQIVLDSKERLSEKNENHVPAAAASKKTKVVRRNTPPPSSSPSSSARIRTKGSLAAEKSLSLSSGKLKSKLASGFKSLFVVDPPKKEKARNPSSFSRTLPSRKPKEIKSIKSSSAAKKTKKVAVDLKSEDDVKEKAVYFTEGNNNEKYRIGQLGLPPSSPKLAFEAGEEGFDDPEASYSDDGNEDDVKNKYKMARESSKVVCPPHKLKFRRGEVVEINSGNNGGLRKLKFKQGRVMGDDCRNGRDGGGKRRFKKKVEDGGGSNPETKTETVTLRHQDGQDNNKKDAQGLLNDVIELTATKLAESRNSKVKALVGAFETVISLQETKPASSATVAAPPSQPSSSSSFSSSSSQV